jgi:uncharacterized protein (TIGR03067 family)
MADNFRAQPPQWSPEPRSPYEHYSEVNFRRPDRPHPTNWWLIVAVVAGVLSVGLIAATSLVLFVFAGRSSTATFAVPATMPMVAGPVPPAAPKPPAEIAAKGTWIAAAMMVDGKEAGDDELAKVKLTIDDDAFTMILPEARHQGVYRVVLDGQIDFTCFGEVPDLAAIYELNGDRLKLCFLPAPRRPTDFSAEKGSQRTLLVLKREDPGRE